jgi:RNA polymerase sigma-70 factor (ECF subfamily)
VGAALTEANRPLPPRAPATGEQPAADSGLALVDTYRRVAPAMFRQALMLLGDQGAAEDVVQEAFLRTWRRRDRLRDAHGLDGYLVTAARNLALDHLRWRAHRATQDTEEGRDPFVVPRAEEAAADAERLSHALRRLPLEQREVVLLHLTDGLTFPEIAARTGAPVGTVNSRYRYGLARLRELLGGRNGS